MKALWYEIKKSWIVNGILVLLMVLANIFASGYVLIFGMEAYTASAAVQQIASGMPTALVVLRNLFLLYNLYRVFSVLFKVKKPEVYENTGRRRKVFFGMLNAFIFYLLMTVIVTIWPLLLGWGVTYDVTNYLAIVYQVVSVMAALFIPCVILAFFAKRKVDETGSLLIALLVVIAMNAYNSNLVPWLNQQIFLKLPEISNMTTLYLAYYGTAFALMLIPAIVFFIFLYNMKKKRSLTTAENDSIIEE